MCYVTHSLRFTSGATPANLLVSSMAAEPSLPHTCKALVGLKTRSYHAAAHSVRSGRPDALLTELFYFITCKCLAGGTLHCFAKVIGVDSPSAND